MNQFDYSFLEKHVDANNLGEHDPDNWFIHAEFLIWQFAAWQHNHPDCTPIGICPEARNNISDDFIAMVFEDSKGNRYYTHVPESWIAQAKVADGGWMAMQEAQRQWYRDKHH